MKRRYLSVLFLTLLPGLVYADPYYGKRESGWFWYNDPELLEDVDVEPDIQMPAPISSEPVAPREILKKQGEEWEDALATAILAPSSDNIQSYLALTTQIQQQSEDFSGAFKRTIWTTPEFDYSLTRPIAPEAIMAGNQAREQDNSYQLMSIAKKKGLIFYFRSDCPYCHRFSPILKSFAESYGFTVIPVSLDGGGMPDYPYPKSNGALGHSLNVDQVPALFIVDPDRNLVAPVGYGYRDWGQLTAQLLHADQMMEMESNAGYAGITQ